MSGCAAVEKGSCSPIRLRFIHARPVSPKSSKSLLVPKRTVLSTGGGCSGGRLFLCESRWTPVDDVSIIAGMTKSTVQAELIDWLMDGDSAIRWQTMRDVLDKPKAQWKREQRRIARHGWGKRLLGLRDALGTWGGGIYTPKWTSTNYTLLLLRDMGLVRDNKAGSAGARLLIDCDLGAVTSRTFAHRLDSMDLCVTGMYLSLLVYFGVRDERVEMILNYLLSRQMADGGWNCKERRHQSHHGSLHTTINILDGLADYAEYCGDEATAVVAEPMSRAHEFVLQHRLFRSDRTGDVIHEAFTKFSFPPRWHWDVLRGLDYFRRIDAPRDPRLQDAIDLMLAKRCHDGRWKLENHHRGKEFFKLEKLGQPSRWNTLRSLRVHRWWESPCS